MIPAFSPSLYFLNQFKSRGLEEWSRLIDLFSVTSWRLEDYVQSHACQWRIQILMNMGSTAPAFGGGVGGGGAV